MRKRVRSFSGLVVNRKMWGLHIGDVDETPAISIEFVLRQTKSERKLEDDDRMKNPRYILGQSLESLSVEELGNLVRTLEAETERVREEIERKKTDLTTAQALFRS